MRLYFLLLLIPSIVLANPPSGQNVNSTVDTKSNSVAQTNGNNQGMYFNSSTPGTQTIISTPGLAGMYTPSSNECYPSWGAQATGPGTAAGLTSATLSYPCHVKDLSQRIASISVAAFNIGMKDRARRSMENALDYAECAFGDTYLIRKVKGDKCPIMPDPHLADMLLGGMPRDTVRKVDNYIYAPVIIDEPGQLSNNDMPITRNELDNKLNNVFDKAMLK